jgi:hypothetical protein
MNARRVLLGATVALAIGNLHAAKAEQARLGPSFPCPSPRDPLAQLICSSPELSEGDLKFVQAYRALRYQLDPAGQKALRQEAVGFDSAVRQRCGIGKPDSGQATDPAAIPCVLHAYQNQRGLWASRLSGVAAEEAARPLPEHIALQAGLQKLGFLPASASVGGVYGDSTRTAIRAWQTPRPRAASAYRAGGVMGIDP